VSDRCCQTCTFSRVEGRTTQYLVCDRNLPRVESVDPWHVCSKWVEKEKE
jgi:hypothetical protein